MNNPKLRYYLTLALMTLLLTAVWTAVVMTVCGSHSPKSPQHQIDSVTINGEAYRMAPIIIANRHAKSK